MTKTAEKIETLDLDSRIIAVLASTERPPSATIIGLMNELIKETDRNNAVGRDARARNDTDAAAMGVAHDSEHRGRQLYEWDIALLALLHGSPPKDTNPAVGAYRLWQAAGPVLTYEERLEAHKKQMADEDAWRAKICADRNDAKRRNDREMELRMLADSQARRDRENGFS
jgi:hypothetical protein